LAGSELNLCVSLAGDVSFVSLFVCLLFVYLFTFALYLGWPLVWKTWKCRKIWKMSGKCQWCC